MSDILERLRAVASIDLRTGGFLAHTMDTAKEAADEIERLRAALAAVYELVSSSTNIRMDCPTMVVARDVLTRPGSPSPRDSILPGTAYQQNVGDK